MAMQMAMSLRQCQFHLSFFRGIKQKKLMLKIVLHIRCMRHDSLSPSLSLKRHFYSAIFFISLISFPAKFGWVKWIFAIDVTHPLSCICVKYQWKLFQRIEWLGNQSSCTKNWYSTISTSTLTKAQSSFKCTKCSRHSIYNLSSSVEVNGE